MSKKIKPKKTETQYSVNFDGESLTDEEIEEETSNVIFKIISEIEICSESRKTWK